MKSSFNINLVKILALLMALSLLTLFSAWESVANAQGGGEQQSGRGGRRRSFDPASYLQRLDANGNGAIEPNELSERSRSFVEGLGFNPDETNSLEKIKAKINGDQQSESRGGKESAAGSALGSPERNIVRKVPGFGVSPAERKSVPNFTTVSQPSSGELDGKYGSEIMSQVDAAMSRYDKNSDGKIDQSEMSEGRWGQPDPKESDTNGDGSLSKAEMAERYYRRTRGSASADSGSSTRRSSERSDSSSSRDSGTDDRSSRRGAAREESNRGASERPASGGEERPAEPARSSGGGDRYRKYADGLMEQYDTDKDGNLSKEEVAGMKQKPENADLDNNGMISAGELTEAIANGSMSSRGGASGGASRSSRERSSSNNSESRASDSKPAESGSGGDSPRSGSSRSSGSKFSFLASDKNRDGNVQMHEFTDEWTDEKFEEFKTYDKNGDGVITNAEYRGDSSGRRR
jgi:Ca2+-binding EF-hand superfamily protein